MQRTRLTRKKKKKKNSPIEIDHGDGQFLTLDEVGLLGHYFGLEERNPGKPAIVHLGDYSGGAGKEGNLAASSEYRAALVVWTRGG